MAAKSRIIAGTATGRSANTTTSAPLTASDGVVASASPTSASAASVFVLSGVTDAEHDLVSHPDERTAEAAADVAST